MSRADGVRFSRDLYRNNEMVAGALERRSLSVVGADLRIIPMPNVKVLSRADKRFDQVWAREFIDQAEAVMSEWSEDPRNLCDAEGHHQFGGMMLMAHHNLIGPEGECGGIIRTSYERKERYNAKFATFLEIIDPARIGQPPELAGNPDVIDGRRLDEWGRMIGFYASVSYPGENRRGQPALRYEYVPRETAFGRPVGFHWFRKWRGGVQRGVTDIVRSLRKTQMLDRFDEAVISAAIVNAIYSLYVKSDLDPKTVKEMMSSISEDPEAFIDEYRVNFYDENEIFADGQRVAVLPRGDDLKMEAINRSADSPEAMRRTFQRDVSMSLGTSYATATNDHSDANYSSERSGMLREWRGFLAERKLFAQHVAALPYGAVIEEAIAEGMIDMPRNFPDFDEYRAAYTACEVSGPTMGHIDPEKEAKAHRINVELGERTLTSIGRDNGISMRDSVDELANEIEYFRSKNLLHPYELRMIEAQKGLAAGKPEDGADNTDTGEDPQPDSTEEDANAR
ncbi:MAG TPA: phage portal protein [Parvularcula sp.]|nr:phage portal protein [Parvularcula sp.]